MADILESIEELRFYKHEIFGRRPRLTGQEAVADTSDLALAAETGL